MPFPKLKGRMREYGISQKEMARKLGISEASLNYKINGKVDFKVNEAKIICKILEIENADAFFFDK